MNFYSVYESIREEIINVRRSIHMHPELGFEEFETSKLICSVLEKYDIEYKSGIAKTGIVAKIGTKEDKVLLIRADMDALPVPEKTHLPFSSVNDGIMHACGHDIHIASALSAAIVLKKHEDELNGSVKIVFQPAEETTGGALPMINEGIMDNPRVTCAIGGHIAPDIEVGKIKLKCGPLMASPDDFTIKFIGKSTHGAQPQDGISPIIPASQFVCKTKEISDILCKNNTNVLSVCTIMANGGKNTIPDEAIVIGTFRSFDDESRYKARDILKSHAENIAAEHGAKTEFEYNFLYPPLVNDVQVTKMMDKTASEILGKENVLYFEKPLMTGEDFAYFAKAVPAVFIWYGGKTDSKEPLHSSKFAVSEDAIEVCSKLFCEFAIKYLR